VLSSGLTCFGTKAKTFCNLDMWELGIAPLVYCSSARIPGVNIVGLAAKRATRLYEQEKGKSEGFHVLGLNVVQWLCAPSAAAKDGFDARTLCVMRNKAEANQLCEHISRDCR
jgi:hypothetical protein